MKIGSVLITFTLGRVRVIFVPLWLFWLPDTISLEDLISSAV